MAEEEEYIKRLEKIVDKQDDLLTHLDAKFNQQQALNDTLSKQNQILREDIQKHKKLLKDMNKTVTQHKNVVKKLKSELEQQLKIQQDLHKDYGDVIKELTDELEEEKAKNNPSFNNTNTNASINRVNNTPKNNNKSNSQKVELPPKDFEKDHISNLSNKVKDIGDKSNDLINNSSNSSEPQVNNNNQNTNDIKVCPNCGTEVMGWYVFCDACGTKLN